MNNRLKKIANDLETKVYKDQIHGKIAKQNFIYGMKQTMLEMEEWIYENVCQSLPKNI